MLRWAGSAFSALKQVFGWPKADTNDSDLSDNERAVIESCRAQYREEKRKRQLKGQKLSRSENAILDWSRRRDKWRKKNGHSVPFTEPFPSPPTSESDRDESDTPPPTPKPSKRSKSQSKSSNKAHMPEAAVEGVTPATGALKPLPEDAPAALKRVYKDFRSNDDYEYPNEYQQRMVPIEEAILDRQSSWRYTSRIFKSNGNVSALGAEKRPCTGTWTCPTCKTKRARRTSEKINKSKPHERPTCAECEAGTHLVYTPCPAYVTYKRVMLEDSEWIVWEHHRTHNHERHAVSGVSKAVDYAVAKQVVAYPSATPLQHRAGTAGRDSRPLTAESRNFIAPGRLRYAIEKAKRANGIPLSSKSSFSHLQQLDDVLQELGETFLIKSSISKPSYLLFQTPFMRTVLSNAVKGWVEAAAASVVLKAVEPDSEIGREGAVTDSDHTYLASEKLLTCCVWDSNLGQYVPVLWGVVRRLDSEHHVEFFLTLMEQIAEAAGPNYGDHLLQQIMDFSAAQLDAFRRAYVRFNAARNPVQDPKVAEFRDKRAYEEAGRLVTGCRVHWIRSRNLLRDSHRLVSKENRDLFVTQTDRLLATRSFEEFTGIMDTLQLALPHLKNWLDWWRRPSIASMIFPACIDADTVEMRKRTAKTSNAVEAQHSLLHRTSGTHLDLIEAIQGLFKRIKDLQERWKAADDGWLRPTRMRESSRIRSKIRPVVYDNDGRPPDTVDTLMGSQNEDDLQVDTVSAKPTVSKPRLKRKRQVSFAADDSTAEQVDGIAMPATKRARSSKTSKRTSSHTQSSETRPSSSSGTTTTSGSGVFLELAYSGATSMERSATHGSYGYKWQNNSCWIDSSLELFIRAVIVSIPSTERTRFYQIVSHSQTAPLYKIAQHIKARQRWWKADGRGWNDLETGSSHLRKGQQDVLELVRTKEYGFVLHPNGTGDPRALLGKLFIDRTSEGLRTFTGFKFRIVYECSAGHTTYGASMLPPSPLHTVFPSVMGVLRTEQLLEAVTIEDYLSNMLPLHEKIPPFHRSEPSPNSCSHAHCAAAISTTHIETFWPTLLHIIPDAVNARDVSQCCHFLKTITLHDLSRGGSKVSYSLVGKVLFQPPGVSGGIGHFVTYLWAQGSCFLYDGLAAGGRLVKQSSDDGLLAPNKHSVLFVYARDQPGRDISTLTTSDRLEELCAQIPSRSTVREDAEEYIKRHGTKHASSSESSLNLDEAISGAIDASERPESKTRQRSRTSYSPDARSPSPDGLIAIGETLIGRFIPVKWEGNGMRYPARVIDIDPEVSDALLEWFPHVERIANGPEGTVYLTITDCLAALRAVEYDTMAWHSDAKYGRVLIPRWLQDSHPNELDLTDPPIENELRAAEDMFIKIALGQLDHPVLHLFEDWCAEHGVNPQRRTKPFEGPDFRFKHAYPLPLVPHDTILVGRSLNRVALHLRKLRIADPFHTMRVQLELIAGLIVLRVRLRRTSADDNDIWELWRAGRIRRHFTMNELALACYSAHGPEELRQSAATIVTEGAERYTQFTDHAGEDITIWDAIIVTADANGADHIWSGLQASHNPSPSSKITQSEGEPVNTSTKRPHSLSTNSPPAGSPLTPVDTIAGIEEASPHSLPIVSEPRHSPVPHKSSKKRRMAKPTPRADVGVAEEQGQVRRGTRVRRVVNYRE